MAIADVRTFWSAVVRVFARVLLTCAAALRFTAAARTRTPAAVVGSAPRADRGRRCDRVCGAGGAASSGSDRSRTVRRPDVVRPGRGPAQDRDRMIPAPRRDGERDRDRTLPPTMKQRIRAEAHGSSPTARSVLAAGVPAPVQTPPVRTPAPAGGTGIPAPRPRAHEARCE